MIMKQKKLVSSNSVRYSALLILPYFDIVRMYVVDPMHNLLLGTAKRMMELWTTVDPQIISNTEFNHIHKVASALNVPKCWSDSKQDWLKFCWIQPSSFFPISILSECMWSTLCITFFWELLSV